MTEVQTEQTIPIVESNVADLVDADADVDDKVVAPTGATENAETQQAAEEPVWPPPDWKDTFVVPRNYLIVMINVVPHVLTELAHDNETATKYAEAGGAKVPVVFFSHNTKKTDFKDGEWDPKHWRLHPAPDLPGLAKGIYIHATTLSQIQEIKDVYPVVGLVWHPVPHPKSHDIFVIQELYVMPGATINVTMIGDKPCFYCRKGATRACNGCETVLFCSQTCADFADQSGMHTTVDCRMAMRKRVETDAVRARERIIEKHAQVESDRQNRAERLKAQEEKKEHASTYKDQKRARLRLESALARKQLGMEPSQHLTEFAAAVEEQTTSQLPTSELPTPNKPKDQQ